MFYNSTSSFVYVHFLALSLRCFSRQSHNKYDEKQRSDFNHRIWRSASAITSRLKTFLITAVWWRCDLGSAVGGGVVAQGTMSGESDVLYASN